MKLCAIAAMGQNREIGWKGDMPWKRGLKQDLAFFKQQTAGHPIVMGRKTFESLPGMLPGRHHIVITTSDLPPQKDLEVFASLEEFQKTWQAYPDTVYVIGGASLYRQLLEACEQLILTEIEADFEADTWFPAFDRDNYTITILDDQQDGAWHTRHVCYTKKPV